MITTPQDLLQQALSLPETDRAALAACLFRSLDQKVDTNAEQEWATEIQRRIAEIDKEGVDLIPWDSVVQEMRDRGNG